MQTFFPFGFKRSLKRRKRHFENGQRGTFEKVVISGPFFTLAQVDLKNPFFPKNKKRQESCKPVVNLKLYQVKKIILSIKLLLKLKMCCKIQPLEWKKELGFLDDSNSLKFPRFSTVKTKISVEEELFRDRQFHSR